MLLLFDKLENPEPWGISQKRGQRSRNKVREIIMGATTVCGIGHIETDYLSHVTESADYALVFIVRNDVRGFLMATEENKSIFVDIVCSSSPSMGEFLLNQIELLAFKKGKKMLRLNALNHVVGYYRKLLFVNSKTTCVDRFKNEFEEFKRNRNIPGFLKLLEKNKLAEYDHTERINGKDEKVYTYFMTKCITGPPTPFFKHVRTAKRKSPYYKHQG